MRQGAQPLMESRPMSERDLTALRSAVAALEHPSLAARLGNMAGKPIELIGSALPAAATQAISAATSKALEIALQVALRTMQGTRPSLSQRFHKVLATASGAAGGALGLASLPIELPVSTVIMLRPKLRAAKARTYPIRKRRWRACRFSHWADGPRRPTLLKAGISPCAPCWQRACHKPLDL